MSGMHLAKGLTSLNTKKAKKIKLTKSKRQQLEDNWKKHNKAMKESNLHSCQYSRFEDYLEYVFGTSKVSKRKFQEYTPPKTRQYRENTVPSRGIGVGNGLAIEKQKYTGTLIKGICQTHKSNAVPVISKKEIVDIGHMRRN